MTGFRVALGGAQSIYDISPDITVLGKIIGGGLPVGAVGGKRSLMSLLAPSDLFTGRYFVRQSPHYGCGTDNAAYLSTRC